MSHAGQGGSVASAKQLNHLLVQSTAALRNLASNADRIQGRGTSIVEGTLKSLIVFVPDFVDADILPTVGALLSSFSSTDLVLNVARVLG
jgi:hypothetical protein